MVRLENSQLSVAFLLWPGFPLLSLAGFCDALRLAADGVESNPSLRCSWSIIGLQGEQVQASCGISVAVQSPLPEPGQFDYIVVIGGPLSRLDDINAGYWHYLHSAAAADLPLVGLGTGSFVLARAGLLDDRVACVHSFHHEDYRRLFPQQRVISHTDYLIDGKRITCAGGIAVIELASQLIRIHCGPERAAKVIHQMTVNHGGPLLLGERRHVLGELSVQDVAIRHCIMLMEENLELPLSIATLADHVDLSSRQLARKFHEELGVAPQEFYRRMRLRYGRWLLLTTEKSITDIAYECGFADASHFIRGFKEAYGTSPARLRAHSVPSM
ncbi:GlxA family transcriptional regulator [Herbaspirillum sp. AP21]|uniref:GlxA family transcriptional regulator n=1 Tax=unclassified Herbaspirillum TaxID=2624150 RepID=UPI00351A807E